MKKGLFRRKIVLLFLAGTLLGAGAGWGYYHYAISGKYDVVTNATPL